MILHARRSSEYPWLPVSDDGGMAMAWAVAESQPESEVRCRRWNEVYNRYEQSIVWYGLRRSPNDNVNGTGSPMIRMFNWVEISEETYNDFA